MMVRDSLASLGKLTLSLVGTTPLITLFSEFVAIPVWGVPVTVVMAAGAGAGLSLFFGDPIESRRSLIGQLLAAMVFGAASAVLIADGMGWKWARANLPMFALIVAALIRWFLPTIIERGKQLIRDFKFPFARGRSGPDKEQM